MDVVLTYLSNTNRIILSKFSCERNCLLVAVKDKLNEYGYPFDNLLEKIYIEERESYTQVVYSEVVLPNNAATLFKKDGYSFSIHSNEEIHSQTPHIHVQWADGDISVRLDDFTIVKRNTKKAADIKKAVSIIRRYEIEFLDAWNAVVNEKNILRAYQLFDR